MKFWKQIKQWLFSRKQSNNEIATDIDDSSYVGKIELENIIEKIKRVIKKAEDHNQKTHGFIIKQEIDKYHNVLNKHSGNQLNYFDSEIIKCKIAQTVQTNFVQAYLDESDEIISSNKNEINIIHSRFSSQERELQKFKSNNKLTRDANYPSTVFKLLKILLMVSLILVEGILNAYFFAQGIDSGLIGGFIFAVGFAFVNVMFAFMFGCYLVRYVFHANFIKKSIGLFFGIISLSFMILWGLALSHYRDALSLMLTDLSPQKIALQTLLNSPFQLQDIMSWCLFCISVLFAIIALIDGLFLDDKYPGYGKIFRHYEKIRDEYFDLMEEVNEQLSYKKEQYMQKIASSYQEGQTKLVNYSDFIQSKSDYENRYQSDYSAIKLAFKALLEWDNIPEDDWVKFQGHDLPILNWNLDKDKTEYQAQIMEFEKFKNNKDNIVADIQSTFQARYSSLNSIYDIVQNSLEK